MKDRYIDIMEAALDAYGDERVNQYFADVQKNGLSEHGFPRLTADIGILIALGRKRELLPLFLEMMDFCCREVTVKEAANDFSVKELCFAILLLREKKAVDGARLDKWVGDLKKFNPYTMYSVVAKTPDDDLNNWAAYNFASDFLRGIVCGIDTSEYVDMQAATQLRHFDSNGCYEDPNCPTLYDYATRAQVAVLLHFGYRGKYRAAFEHFLADSVDYTLKTQSVSGEIPYGGRSNGFYFNEAYLASVLEFSAADAKRKGNSALAGECKKAANLAADSILRNLRGAETHHVKNSYDRDSMIGCEHYAYFDKYMISLASFIYLAYLFADDGIEPTECPAEKGGFLYKTGENFHKVFLNAGGYAVEYDTDAFCHYDANGLGRIHKVGCPSPLCLSAPLPKKPDYKLEFPNPAPMSLCAFAERNGKTLSGADAETKYALLSKRESEREVSAVFSVTLSDNTILKETCTASADGVVITLDGDGKIGYYLPVFAFDGSEKTEIEVRGNGISLRYHGALCRYDFDSEPEGVPVPFCNRYGRYLVYKIPSRRLTVTMEREKGEKP